MGKETKHLFIINTKDLAEAGMLIGLSLILNFIKIPIATSGGSINLQLLPLFILSLRKGPFKGFIFCGVCYGLITCLIDNYGFATFPFDYLIGFGSSFVLGFFKGLILSKEKPYSIKGELFLLLACVLATFIRFIGSNLSSMLIYGYSFKASLVYNAVYVGVSGLASTILMMILLGPLSKIDNLFPTSL